MLDRTPYPDVAHRLVVAVDPHPDVFQRRMLHQRGILGQALHERRHRGDRHAGDVEVPGEETDFGRLLVDDRVNLDGGEVRIGMGPGVTLPRRQGELLGRLPVRDLVGARHRRRFRFVALAVKGLDCRLADDHAAPGRHRRRPQGRVGLLEHDRPAALVVDIDAVKGAPVLGIG